MSRTRLTIGTLGEIVTRTNTVGFVVVRDSYRYWDGCVHQVEVTAGTD